MTLDEIAIKHNTDKSSRSHGYTEWYERHFHPFVGSKVTLLEIGIATGASLRTWREYLGSEAKVIGLDLDRDACLRAEANGFKSYHGSQSDPAMLRLAMTEQKPSIIVDDGSHHAADQITSFETLFPLLPDGGFYVIEDLHAAYWGWGGDFVKYVHQMVDRVNNHGYSGFGNIGRDAKNLARLDPLALHMVAMHCYPSIVFVEKRSKRI